MKNLYFLDEEEKNRILNIHESATKKQYLKEEETNIQKIARNLFTAASGPGTDTTLTTGIPAWINQIKDVQTYNAVNAQLKLQSNGYNDIPSLINGETIDYPGMKSIINHLKTIGIQSTATMSDKGQWVNKGGFRVTSITPIASAKPAATTPAGATPAGTTPTSTTKPQVNIQQRRQQIIQQIQNTTKSIQKSLGQPETGVMDSSQVERLIGLLQQ